MKIKVIELKDLLKTAGFFYKDQKMMELYVFLSQNFLIYKSRNLRAVMVVSRSKEEFISDVSSILKIPGLISQMNQYFNLDEDAVSI